MRSIFFIIFSIPVLLFGQNIRAGLVSGYSLSYIIGIHNYESAESFYYRSLGNLSCSFISELKLNNRTYLATQLKYQRKGSYFEKPNGIYENSYRRIHLHYIELPLIIGYKYKIATHKSLLFEGGLSYGKLFKKAEYNNFANELKNQSAIDKIAENDFSLIINLKYPLLNPRKEKFFVAIHTAISILSLQSEYNLRNFVIGTELSYLF